MTISIHPVQPEQFADWLRLRMAVYTGIDQKFHEQEMQLIVADDSKQCFVVDGETHGVCGMIEVSLRNAVDGCLTSPIGYVEGIYIDPPLRGSGLSRQLMLHAEQWFRSQGCSEMATDAELDNKSAQRFHEHMGFEETYRIVEYRKRL